MSNRIRGAAVLCCVALLAAGPTQAEPSAAVTISANVGCSAFGYGWWGLPPATGTFSASGALSDSGQVYGPNTMYAGGTPPTPLTLSGASGSLTVCVANGAWSITGGTGDYLGSTGGGTATVTTTVHSWYGWILGYSYTYSLTGSVG